MATNVIVSGVTQLMPVNRDGTKDVQKLHVFESRMKGIAILRGEARNNRVTLGHKRVIIDRKCGMFGSFCVINESLGENGLEMIRDGAALCRMLRKSQLCNFSLILA